MPGSPGTRPAPELPPERRLALVVATTRYKDASLRHLRAPARDAADFSEVLADPGIGGFKVTQVIDRSAQEIRLAVEEFLTDRNPEDLLVVYVSCHGLIDLRRRLYFAATDTRKTWLAATGVEAQWLLDQMEDCRARRQVVILDCCFSGAFAAGAKGATDLGLGERFYGHGRGRVVLTASRGSEYSFEGDPVPGSVQPGSVFTGALVAGLRTGAADGDNDGYIYVDDAYAYAFDQVQAAGANQTPQRWLYGAEGKILLARSPAGIGIVPTSVPEAPSATTTASPTLEKPRAPAERVLRWMPPPRTRRSKVALTVVLALLAATAATAMLVLRTGTGSGRSARGSPTGHTDGVTSVAFSPDSKLLASASLDHTVRLWNPATEKPIGQPLSGHTGHVQSVAFSPDGKILASGGEDGTIRRWNPRTGKPIGQPLTGHTATVRAVAFSPDGKLLASGGEDNTLRLWNPATGALLTYALTAHTGWVTSVAFSPDGKRLASGSEDTTVRLWNPASGKAVRRPLTGHTGNVTTVAFSPDGKRLASGSEDTTVRLWNAATGQAVGRPLAHGRGRVFSLAFSPNGKLLATGTDDSLIRLWDPATGQLIGTPLVGHHSWIYGLAFSPDGKTLASASGDDTVRLWNPASGQPIGGPLG